MARGTNRGPRNRQTTKPEEVKLPVEDFMAEKNAEEEISTPEVKEEVPVVKAKIARCNKLRLRNGASTEAAEVEILGANNVLILTNYDPKAEWTEVEAVDDLALGSACFVMTKFIEVI